MDTTKQREEFEAWWEAPEQLELRKSCARGWGMFVWQAAQKAAIASIAIELPSQEKYDDPLSAHTAIKDCADLITAAGLRVKS